MIFNLLSSYYFIVIPLQIICIIHALRTERRQWILLLFFLPLIGSGIYFFKEIWPGLRRGNFSAKLQKRLNPNQRVREWERKVMISDNITNKLGLSNAYAEQKQYDKAIELAKQCLKGLYADDPAIILQLARQYFYAEQYTESVTYFDKLNGITKGRFSVVEDELLYVRALEGIGEPELADEGYRRIIKNHHSLEGRYYYGLFLKSQSRNEEARLQFQAIRDELKLLPGYLRRRNAKWARLAFKERTI